MALLQVHEFPDPILQQHAMPVTVFDDKLRQLSADMLETMYEERGIGLAANQVAARRPATTKGVQRTAKTPRPVNRASKNRISASSGMMICWACWTALSETKTCTDATMACHQPFTELLP